jgi:hypothetical protein
MATTDQDPDDDLDDDLDDDDVRAALAVELPEITEAQIDALLADETFAGIAAGATRKYEQMMTEEGLSRARRTLAVVFLTEPHAAALLARAREAGPPAATDVKERRGAVPSDGATRRRSGRQ